MKGTAFAGMIALMLLALGLALAHFVSMRQQARMRETYLDGVDHLAECFQAELKAGTARDILHWHPGDKTFEGLRYFSDWTSPGRVAPRRGVMKIGTQWFLWARSGREILARAYDEAPVKEPVPSRLPLLIRVLSVMTAIACIVSASRMMRAVRKSAEALAENQAFMRNVSHELKTPLAASRLWLEMADNGNGVVNDEQVRASLTSETMRMQRLVANLLTAGRVYHPHVTEFNPSDIVKRAMKVVTRLDGITTKFVDCRMRSDSDALMQVTLNLLTNAVKYARAPYYLTLQVREDSHLEMVVRDSGDGVTPEVLEKLFERDFRARPDTAPGLGLGLYISRMLAQTLGGELTAQNHPEGGLQFTLVLPGVLG